jgi:hypothetical protein
MKKTFVNFVSFVDKLAYGLLFTFLYLYTIAALFTLVYTYATR